MTSHFDAPSSRSLLVRLAREWSALAERPAVLARAARWELGVPFRSLDDVVIAAGYWSGREARLAAASAEASAQRGDEASAVRDPAGDPVLARLLLAARSDDLAARVVLQRLLPGIVARARVWARRAPGNAEALDELLAVAWSVIRTYPLERRPTHLAANLLRDAEYHAFIRATRRTAVLEPTPPHLLDLPVEVPDRIDPLAELAELVAAAHRSRALTDRDLRLVRLLVRGTSVAAVAAELEVSVRTITNHRDALVHRLRQTARELAAA
jgi:DNA-binding CsgD family transcriptional regulator